MSDKPIFDISHLVREPELYEAIARGLNREASQLFPRLRRDAVGASWGFDDADGVRHFRNRVAFYRIVCFSDSDCIHKIIVRCVEALTEIYVKVSMAQPLAALGQPIHLADASSDNRYVLFDSARGHYQIRLVSYVVPGNEAVVGDSFDRELERARV